MIVRNACIGLMISALCCLAHVAADAQRRVAPPARAGRETTSLDGPWKFRTDPNNQGIDQGWSRAAPNETTAATVPSQWGAGDAPNYAGAAWYWRAFDVPAHWQGQTIRLRFEGAAERAQVWLNGQPLGEHNGGDVPFEFNVTSTIHVGGSNLLALRLDGNAAYGAGLWQSVLLLAHDEAYLDDCFPQANAVGELNALIELSNLSEKSGDATLEARLVAATAPGKNLQMSSQNLHITPGNNRTILLLTLPAKQLALWSPDTPTLYRLQLAFRQDRDILDTLDTELGFRSIDYQKGAVTLNGSPIKITAQAPIFFKTAFPIATQEEAERVRGLLKGLKAQGVTVIYLASPPPFLLQLADEVGVLVVERSRPGEPDATRATELHDLLLRDRAHPCILAWDLSDMDQDTIQLLRDLDPTRLLLTGSASAPMLWPPDQRAAVPLPSTLGLTLHTSSPD